MLAVKNFLDGVDSIWKNYCSKIFFVPFGAYSGHTICHTILYHYFALFQDLIAFINLSKGYFLGFRFVCPIQSFSPSERSKCDYQINKNQELHGPERRPFFSKTLSYHYYGEVRVKKNPYPSKIRPERSF